MTTTANVSSWTRFMHSIGYVNSTLLREDAAQLIQQADTLKQQADTLQSNLSGIDEAIEDAQNRIDLARQHATDAKRPVANLIESEAAQLSRVTAVQEEIARLQAQLVIETDQLSQISGNRLGAIVTLSDEELELATQQTRLSELNLRKANETSGLEVQINRLTLRASMIRTDAAKLLSEAARVDAKRA